MLFRSVALPLALRDDPQLRRMRQDHLLRQRNAPPAEADGAEPPRHGSLPCDRSTESAGVMGAERNAEQQLKRDIEGSY